MRDLVDTIEQLVVILKKKLKLLKNRQWSEMAPCSFKKKMSFLYILWDNRIILELAAVWPRALYQELSFIFS